MLFFYRILINITFLLSPLIILFRVYKKKEDTHRVKEKLGFFSQTRKKGKLIWFHGASVGEFQSIVPLLEKYEKDKKISQILVTSNTLSSSKIISKVKSKKIIHQFFPIDTSFLSKKFLEHWKPSLALFVDSEIWPNMILNLEKKNIPFILINGRITKKTFNRWMNFLKFSKNIFSKFKLCLSASNESKNYLKKLGAPNIKYIGNLKFSQSENEINKIDSITKKYISKKIIWCASSTHYNEEEFCGNVHQKLKSKYKNLLTIIIPRHIDRVNEIESQLKNLGLKTHKEMPKRKIPEDTDIYIVNSYGKTKSFFSICKNVFLGGSIINHGGQNPLEAARFGCNILHGKNVKNFEEIYKFLKNQNITFKISQTENMVKALNSLLKSKKNLKKNIKNKINFMGKRILKNTLREINVFL
jgi:3-deoxy-D-manno-octulosonic-acid transferase